MAIRFDPELNSEIYRVVKNFNRKRNRAIKKGFRDLPPPLKVSELKARYTKRSDLTRDLELISQFNTEDALESVENSGGATAIKWEVEYLRNNIRKAKNFYDREIKKLAYLDTELLVSKKEMLNNLKAKRAFLDLELSTLNQSDYNTYKATINEYLSSNLDRLSNYRGWLNEVETIMRHLGYDNKTIQKFFEGFDQLTPSQFVTMYRQSNLVSRIYELYIPTRDGDFMLSTTEDDAKNLIETFMEEKEDMIKRAKFEDEMANGDKALEEFVKETNKMVFEERKKPSNKIKRETLTQKEIDQLKELGWEDIIE